MKLKHLFFTLVVMASFSTAQAQVKIGANPSAIGTSSSLEVEATNGNKTMVNKTNGQLTVQDGSQGANKVLTSDANGLASWKDAAESGIVKLIFAGFKAASQPVAANNAGSLIYVTSDYDPEGGFDPAVSEYTVNKDGYYQVSFSGDLAHNNNSNAMPGGFVLQVKRTGTTSWQNVVTYGSSSLPTFYRSLGGTTVTKAQTADKFRVISSTCLCGTTSEVWDARNTTLAVVRLK